MLAATAVATGMVKTGCGVTPDEEVVEIVDDDDAVVDAIDLNDDGCASIEPVDSEEADEAVAAISCESDGSVPNPVTPWRDMLRVVVCKGNGNPMRDFGILIFSCEREVNEDEVTLSDDGAVSAASTSIT